MRRRLLLVLTAALVATAVSGCGMLGGSGAPSATSDPCATPATHPSTVVVLLFDKSQSTGSREARAIFHDGVTTVLDFFAQGRGGLLAADVIDQNSLLHSRYPVRCSYPTKSFNTNPVTYHARVNHIDAVVTGRLDPIIDGSREHEGTTILDALTVAGRLFDNYPDATRRTLVLFSDMVEESPRLHFTARVLTPGGTRAAIAREQKRTLFPHLDGVRVFVVGAGVTAENQLTGAKAEKIEQFWLRCFDAAGADASAA